MQNLLNPHLSGLEEYTPIQPFEVLSKRLGIPASQIVKLDANENPYGPLPAVAEALAEYPYYHIYPDPQQSELREALSDWIALRLRLGLAIPVIAEIDLNLIAEPV